MGLLSESEKAESDRRGHVLEKVVEIHSGSDVEGAMLPFKGAEAEDRLAVEIISFAVSDPAKGQRRLHPIWVVAQISLEADSDQIIPKGLRLSLCVGRKEKEWFPICTEDIVNRAPIQDGAGIEGEGRDEIIPVILEGDRSI